MNTPRRPHPAAAAPRHERGATLIIALIILVAMSLAGIATMRSVDTSAIVAGNIAFRESAANAADQGLQAGHAWVTANAGTNTLYNDNNVQGNTSIGFFSSVTAVDKDWSSPNSWSNAATINGGLPDASGNTIHYVIERLCAVPNCAPNATCGGTVNVCGSTPDNAAVSGEGVDQSSPNFFTRPPAMHYRVSSRSMGPRNSISVVQAHVRTQ
jgi:type IV pilus assembly protein PilX